VVSEGFSKRSTKKREIKRVKTAAKNPPGEDQRFLGDRERAKNIHPKISLKDV